MLEKVQIKNPWPMKKVPQYIEYFFKMAMEAFV
jgi:hypothetical protein